MAHYRAYFIGRDGHFMKAVDLICHDDEGARKYARQMVDRHDVELWQHDRRIEKFEGRSDSGISEPTSKQVGECPRS
jgi:hypothetical protein